jgi:DNA gyrase/topoisomerase IV subunit A
MIKKFIKFFLVLVCGSMLAFVAVKMARIEKTVVHVARPSRLFNPKFIESHFPPRKEWDVKTSSQQERFFYVISQQPLRWLGRGMQAVVFETQDEKYVVKFFQLGRIREDDSGNPVKDLLSRETKEKRQERIKHREEIFSSSKMCFENLQEETGIVYVHLNRTKDRVRTVRLVDRYGQSHRIRGDDTSFLVQKKARYLIPTITQHMERGEIGQAKARIDQVFTLLLSLAKKGYVDGDDALIRNNNLGLTEDRAIYIDTGHLFHAQNLDAAERMKYEFQVRLDPLEKWLHVAYPELGDHYQTSKTRLLESLFPQTHGVDAP